MTVRSTSAADDPRWDQYGGTVLEMLDDRSLRIDLTQPVAASAIEGLMTHGIGPTFAVVAATDPHGQHASIEANRNATEALLAEVKASGWAWIPADGVSLDGSHREPGYAIATTRANALELARRFAQSAIFWFDGVTMWIVGAVVAAPDRRLPE